MSTQNVRQIQRFATRRAAMSPITVFTLEELGNYSDEKFHILRDYCDRLNFDPYDSALKAESIVRDQEVLTYKAHEFDWSDAWDNLTRDPKDGLSGVRYWLERVNSDEAIRQLTSIQPYRKHASYKFLVSSEKPYQWSIRGIGSQQFLQKITDARDRTRVFMPIADDLVNHTYFQWLVAAVAQLAFQIAGVVSRRFYVTAHFIQTHALASGCSSAPEFIHQDGSNFIVSELVLRKNNDEGGVSRIYCRKPEDSNMVFQEDRSKLIAVQRQLVEGEGVFKAGTDNGYWHSISDVSKKIGVKDAYRSVLGFDIGF